MIRITKKDDENHVQGIVLVSEKAKTGWIRVR